MTRERSGALRVRFGEQGTLQAVNQNCSLFSSNKIELKQAWVEAWVSPAS